MMVDVGQLRPTQKEGETLFVNQLNLVCKQSVMVDTVS